MFTVKLLLLREGESTDSHKDFHSYLNAMLYANELITLRRGRNMRINVIEWRGHPGSDCICSTWNSASKQWTHYGSGIAVKKEG